MTEHIGKQFSGHISDDDLADLSVGLAEPARSEQLETHLSGCADCTHRLAAIRQVSLVLAGQPTPAMPADVFARLNATVDSLARATGTDGPNLPPSSQSGPIGTDVGVPSHRAGLPRPTLGRLEDNLSRRAKRPGRLLFGALGACALAGLVGFGGYVISAVSGHNEPSADAPLVVSGTKIGPAVSAEPGVESLSSHRFSSAWNCARKATDGRITGIQTSVVDGRSGLMVYLAGPGDTTRVVFVSGCDSDRPTAGPSTLLPRR